MQEKQRRQKDNNLVNAILLRHKGVPFSEAIKRAGVSGDEFFFAVGRLDGLIGNATHKSRETLEGIAAHPEARERLFEMDMDYLKEQYGNIRNGEQKRYVHGTRSNPKNLKGIDYLNKKGIIDAILLRFEGVPYSEILRRFRITPGIFYRAVFSDIENLISLAPESARKTLRVIAKSEFEKSELFRMEEDFVKKQYNRIIGRIKGEKQYELFPGTLTNPANREFLTYYALASNHKILASGSRENRIRYLNGEMVNGSRMPRSLLNHFHEIGLGGLLTSRDVNKKKAMTVLGVLELYDAYLQKSREEPSLFDLSEELHLHKWRRNFRVPRRYWGSRTNADEAVHHTYKEFQKSALEDRGDFLKGLARLPNRLYDWFAEQGLLGLWQHYKNSGLNPRREMYSAIDRSYMAEFPQSRSLFNKSQQSYAVIDRKDRLSLVFNNAA